jgi:uncharacterized protein DUF3617
MNRMTIIRATSLLLPFALSLTPLHAADRVRPGKWEFNMTTGGVTRSMTTCMTPAQAALSNGDTATARAAAQKASRNCVIKAYDVTGATVTFDMVCQGTRLESTATYHGDSSEGVLKTTREGKTTSTAIKAHRLGDCDAK